MVFKRKIKNIERPHNKSYLTTSFGRFIDSISYLRLLGITFIIWLTVSLYFFIATYYNQGMNFDPVCSIGATDECIRKSLMEVFSSALYFSGVTLTTLGYGDISPIGFGRVVAVLLSMSGLTIIAVLISKISSERQSSLLLLLHTSDVERRMFDFEVKIDAYILKISNSFDGNEIDEDLIYKELRGLRSLLEAIMSYIAFHVNQSMLLEIGSEAAIKNLMLKMGDVHETIESLELIALNTEKIETGCLSVAKRMRDIETFLDAQNNEKNTRVKNINISMLKDKYMKLKNKYNSSFTEAKIMKVENLLPKTSRGEWPKDLNRTIADELGVSTAMVKKCIAELRKRGKC
ncbi:potassium channel family protein [Marinomonas ostreistagni]|uniref:potassium channel family protein n=1 Tax=Marinomonas ostreistagni TaxID=359209 RepID=UPI001951A7DA|nr:potassium channel family protein [Marinomonas ostreistagni]MBM6549888.1 two pore domain potassium channel family protein [Marinomonas ostreistagni]